MLAPYEALDTNALPARARRSPLLKSVFALLFAAMLCQTSSALTLIAQESELEDVVRVRTDLVTIPVIVTDPRGRRVGGLAQSDFLIHTEGQAQRIRFFATGTSRVVLTFLLDASGSAREYLKEQRDAALSLLSRFGSQSEVSVLQFGDTPTVVVPFSVNIQKAREGFDFPPVSGRHTAIFNAAMAALRLLQERKSDPAERRIVILTSDGLDTASTLKASKVIENARREAVSFYVIHFPIFTPQGGRLAPRRPASGFRDLAEKTGGLYFVVGDARSALAAHAQNDLSLVFKAIEEDLTGQYMLGFYPDELSRDGREHRLEVNLFRNLRNYRVKALREGYRVTR